MGNRKITMTGDVVYRPANWWTPTVHALLNYLHEVGFDRVPQPLGIDGDREMLSHIPGDSGPLSWSRVVPDQGLRAMAELLRDYHDAVRGFVPPPEAQWAFEGDGPRACEIICHGDFGPWNIVWNDLTPVGLLDFDFAHPGQPTWDVAYALEYVAPFRSDEVAMRWHAFAEPPDRRRRIEVFAEAYGLSSADGLVDQVQDVQRSDRDHVIYLADRGVEPQRTWVTEGYIDELTARIQWTEQHHHLFTTNDPSF